MELYFYDEQLKDTKIINGKVIINGVTYRVTKGDKSGIYCKVTS